MLLKPPSRRPRSAMIRPPIVTVDSARTGTHRTLRTGLLACGSRQLDRLPGTNVPVASWSAAPRSQLRDSAGITPASPRSEGGSVNCLSVPCRHVRGNAHAPVVVELRPKAAAPAMGSAASPPGASSGESQPTVDRESETAPLGPRTCGEEQRSTHPRQRRRGIGLRRRQPRSGWPPRAARRAGERRSDQGTARAGRD